MSTTGARNRMQPPEPDHDHDLLMRIEERITGLMDLLDHKFLAVQEQLARLAEQRVRDAAQANEWRGALVDMAQQKMDRGEYERAHADLMRRIDVSMNEMGVRVNHIEAMQAALTGTGQGRLAMVSIGAVIVSLLGLVILIVTHVGGS